MKNESICEPHNPVNVTSKGKLISALKPGGRIQIADILLQNIPEGSKSNVTLWTGCIAGGLLKLQLEQKVLATGFKEMEVI